MQTFLPYPDFEQSAKCLDYRRLGKQRVEAWQLFETVTGKRSGWKSHPAARMWNRYEVPLLRYGLTMCDEWLARGYRDTMRERFLRALLDRMPHPAVLPGWFGLCELHASHRSNLLRKDSKHYGQFGWSEPNDLPYYWPT
jgi:hypothetical protein